MLQIELLSDSDIYPAVRSNQGLQKLCKTNQHLQAFDLESEILQCFVRGFVFLRHLFILGLPLVAGILERLDFAFVVAGLNVGLA